MGENTAIEWATHTFNGWIGCTKVSPGCTNCYAEARSKRFPEQGRWGVGAERKRTGKANWRKPLTWNRKAERLSAYHKDNANAIKAAEDELGERFPAPVRPRVFSASLSDWLDPEVPVEWLADLLALISATPHLDWLLLTKRPQLWSGRLWRICEAFQMGHEPMVDLGESARVLIYDWLHGDPPANVWLGTTVEDQQRADERIPELLRIPARVRFLSCEPLLEGVDLGLLGDMECPGCPGCPNDCPRRGDEINWAICGGESGTGARPMHPDWARSLRDQCQAAGVAFHFKQWGAWVPTDGEGMPARERRTIGTDGKPDILNGQSMDLVGKKKAGRLLDGRTWDEVPAVLP